MPVITISNLLLQLDTKSSNKDEILKEVKSVIDKINLYLSVTEAEGTPLVSNQVELSDIIIEDHRYGDH
jgi:hypothetical protein